MCGIVGIFEYGRMVGGVSSELLVRMRETLHHRGPDGEGIFVAADRKAGLAHRRLAIVDLAGGAQPMYGEDGTVLVFNGEIYNYPVLRQSLEKEGAVFRTNCDTEIILHLYRLYGDRCVEHLVGMFAFAVWDPRRRRLFFARDPLGEKPFYWTDAGGIFLFGSEIKALLEHPLVRPEVNEDALSPYFANLVTPGPETLYRGIYKLAAGCKGHCDERGVTTSRYRCLTEPRRWEPTSREEAVHRVRELLDASVQARLMSDVPVGVLLSGGMDSSTIVALLHQQGTAVDTFTVGFPGYAEHDERAEARWVAKTFRTNHHEVVLTEADALRSIPTLVHHQDEPLADPVCLPFLAVCRLAHENGVKVVLAGEGADELFWGYWGYASVLAKWRKFRALLALPRPMRRVAAVLTSAERHPRRREQLEGIAEGRVHPVHMPVGLTRFQRRRLLASSADGAGWLPAGRSDRGGDVATLAFDTQQYEFEVRLPELLLMRNDRFSMATSVEARVPFLDPALVDYVYRLPLELKIRDGITKFVLKQAVADIVPDRVANRPKQGFAAPTSRWFAARHGAVLRDLLQTDTLRRYFDTDYVNRLLESTNPDSWESGQVLWPILNFGLWHRYWVEGEHLDELVDAPRGPALSAGRMIGQR